MLSKLKLDSSSRHGAAEDVRAMLMAAQSGAGASAAEVAAVEHAASNLG
jgi:hypothetical protein